MTKVMLDGCVRWRDAVRVEDYVPRHGVLGDGSLQDVYESRAPSSALEEHRCRVLHPNDGAIRQGKGSRERPVGRVSASGGFPTPVLRGTAVRRRETVLVDGLADGRYRAVGRMRATMQPMQRPTPSPPLLRRGFDELGLPEHGVQP